MGLRQRPRSRQPARSTTRSPSPYRRCPSTDAVQRAEYADLKVYLPNDPLVKVDRMSMAHSLEVRCPLLDRRVVELAFRIPTRTKMPGMRSKHLLRELARRRLPAEISNLPKKGFTAPIGEWIRGPHRAWFTDEVLGSNARTKGMIDASRLRLLVDEHNRGDADHWHALWAVWVLEHWLRRQAERRSSPRQVPMPAAARL